MHNTTHSAPIATGMLLRRHGDRIIVKAVHSLLGCVQWSNSMAMIRDFCGKVFPLKTVRGTPGRGYKVRREEMRRLIQAADGKVFTLTATHMLIDCTGIEDYRLR